ERRFLSAKQWLGADRDRDVEGPADVGAEEVRSGDADDRERDFVEVQPLSNGARRSAESALPEAVTDDRDRSVWPAASHVVGLGERAPNHRRHTKRFEHAAAGPDPVDELRLAARREIEARRAPGKHTVEQVA